MEESNKKRRMSYGDYVGAKKRDLLSNNNIENNIGNENYHKFENNNFNSTNQSVVKPSLRERLFKAPGSRLWKKLAPYLSRNDSTPAQKLGLGARNSEYVPKGPHSNVLKVSENEEKKNRGTEVSQKAQNFDELNSSGTVVETRLHEDLKGTENGFTSNGVEDSTEQDGVATIDIFNIEVPSNQPNSNGTSSKFSCQLNASNPKGGNGGVEPMSEEGTESNTQDQIRNVNGGGEYTKEHIQTTPPHMDIVSDPGMSLQETKETPKKNLKIESKHFACESAREDICLTNDLNLKRKSVLNPCLQRKVFIHPGSLRYRSLLPYLSDARSNNLHKSLDASKIKAAVAEKKTNTHSLIVDLNSKHTVMGKSEASLPSAEHPGGDLLLNHRTAVPISTADLSDNKLTLISAGKSTELTKLSESENKSKPLGLVLFGMLNDLEQVYGAVSSNIEMISPANLSCSFDEKETIHRDDVQQCNFFQGTEALDKSTQVGKAHRVCTKGILRRNLLGCRGLCNCLNCTSFRLNADKAVEFSRNQLLDAEELAFGLIKEVSGLRNMLKECTTKSETTAGYQVMEACNKAQKAEEVAICRLQEMNSDLSAHCRKQPLERSRVRFADHVKKMLIPQVDS